LETLLILLAVLSTPVGLIDPMPKDQGAMSIAGRPPMPRVAHLVELIIPSQRDRIRRFGDPPLHEGYNSGANF
jgi:hypothetical protein